MRCSRVFCTRFTGEHENDFADTAEYEGSLLALLRETQAFVKRHHGRVVGKDLQQQN